MPEFRIIESRPATYYWEYIVEADSQKEAFEKVLMGNVEADEAWCDVNLDDDTDSDFELID